MIRWNRSLIPGLILFSALILLWNPAGANSTEIAQIPGCLASVIRMPIVIVEKATIDKSSQGDATDEADEANAADAEDGDESDISMGPDGLCLRIGTRGSIQLAQLESLKAVLDTLRTNLVLLVPERAAITDSTGTVTLKSEGKAKGTAKMSLQALDSLQYSSARIQALIERLEKQLREADQDNHKDKGHSGWVVFAIVLSVLLCIALCAGFVLLIALFIRIIRKPFAPPPVPIVQPMIATPGMMPPMPPPPVQPSKPRNPYFWSMIWTAFGLALVLGQIASGDWGSITFGLIIMLVGVGLFIANHLHRKEMRQQGMF